MTGSAGVVLAGGQSSRMGTAKAALEWHGSTLLRRTVGIVARAAGLTFDRHVTAALNGDQIIRDDTAPLAAGDTVFFMSADAGG